ncbi:MAG: ABC transporter permease [Acholeplasmataceae bacterium]|jgi:spermidine/putrescine transport system permease protein|nr:ABC transporter permease [Acholeplasmataceae bacterium]MDD4469028.1 ABC transporter permease [Acholeplasmataceae bacterium]MDD4824278.1 ABC transporter permease [Acholeplasmataceae bacterium]MDY0316712.1 ABC transporter permease [Acholeplasmatales bacterium]
MKKHNNLLSGIFILLVLLFVYAPIFSLVLFSFNANRSLTTWGGFSFEWYGELFRSREIMNAVVWTFIIAILATIISVIVGTFAAIGLSKNKKLFRNAVINLNNIPIVNPEIVTAIGLLLLFQSLKLQGGYGTMLLAHIAFCTPYVIITVYPKVKSLDPSLIEAAQDLGATPMRAIYYAVFPQIKVAIFAAAAIAFTMSFDDFVISYFTAGSTGTNISIYLYTLKRGIPPTINALSTIMILVVTIVVTLNFILTRKQYKEV